MSFIKYFPIFLALLSHIAWAKNPKIVEITGKLTQEIPDILGSLGLNCASPENYPIAADEISKFALNFSNYLSEEIALLPLKKDYPTACHVLSNHILTKHFSENTDTRRLRNKKRRIDTVVDGSRPKPSYYWPKYFIEVSEKGNDPYPAFAKNNALYMANRKISATIEKLVDIEGAIHLTFYATGGGVLLQGLSKNLFKFDTSHAGISKPKTEEDKEKLKKDLLRNIALSPFEKLRIRASNQKDQPSFEVNIWPVGLSRSLGKLTVCKNEDIGYGWPVPMVPNTCPVAMSRDAQPYWDTGMLDYLDPQAVKSMAISTNFPACMASSVLSEFASQSKVKNNDVLSSDILKKTANLGPKFDGIRSCSWPIISNAQALVNKVKDVSNIAKWTGPYCTIWGPLAPRMSASAYNNDYSYANSALKFKLLAHEIFGIPRGESERWSIAYPWEGPGSEDGPDNGLIESKIESKDVFEKFTSGLDQFKKISTFSSHVGSEDLTKIPKPGDDVSRSTELFFTGDPRLIDTSFAKGYWLKRTEEIAKEAAYMGTLAGLSAATVAAFNNKDNVDVNHQINKLNKKLEVAEQETIPWGEEPIYQEVLYCHQSEQGKGLMTPGNLFNMGLHPTDIPKVYREMPFKGPSFQFKEVNSEHECLNEKRFSGCLKWKGRWGGCKEYNDGIGILYRKMKVVGSRKVKDPIKVTYNPVCSFVGRNRVKNNKDIVFYKCKDVEVSREQMPRENVDRPQHTDVYPKDEKSDELIKSVEAAAPWIAAEIARAQYGNIMGSNFLPGNKRIYVIWEKITCDTPFIKVTIKHDFGEQSIYKDLPETGVKNPDYSQFESAGASCRTAIRYELYKRFQTKYMRDWCDLIGKGLGDPFKY